MSVTKKQHAELTATLLRDWRKRLSGQSLRQQPLARAVGFPMRKWQEPPRILDATAGFARDAFLLAALGCMVTATERSGEVFDILLDPLSLAKKDPKLAPLLESKIHFFLGDARSLLALPASRNAFDVIYLDPMYPEKKKSALPKKEMLLLRKLVGSDEDATELFAAARRANPERIVVKRPPHAPDLALGKAHSFESKLARFDLYLRLP